MSRARGGGGVMEGPEGWAEACSPPCNTYTQTNEARTRATNIMHSGGGCVLRPTHPLGVCQAIQKAAVHREAERLRTGNAAWWWR